MALPRGIRNNNPCNIRLNGEKWIGEVFPSTDTAFKQFISMAYGYRAVFVLLRNYQKKYGLNTIEQLIRRYAPPMENSTEAYIKKVSEMSGISRNEIVDTTSGEQMKKIVSAMSLVENGIRADESEVNEGWRIFSS